MKGLALSLVLVLATCGGPSPPSGGGWSNYAKGNFTQLPPTFTIGTNPVMGYVTTASGPLHQGQTMTLNYTINGNGPYGINDPTDIPPASITLFIWERGDDLSGTNQYAYYRWWCPSRAVLAPGPGQLSCVIGGQWTNVNGVPASEGSPTDPLQPGGGFAQAIANPQGVGFTFGGGYFYGHGVTDGSTTFTINNWSVQ